MDLLVAPNYIKADVTSMSYLFHVLDLDCFTPFAMTDHRHCEEVRRGSLFQVPELDYFTSFAMTYRYLSLPVTMTQNKLPGRSRGINSLDYAFSLTTITLRCGNGISMLFASSAFLICSGTEYKTSK